MPEVIFSGTAGRIEGRYHDTYDKNAPIALILHPHPKFDGTMNNKVTYALFRCFKNLGFNTLRFNFRGVGRSEGTHDNGEGELKDAASALNWLQNVNPNAKQCWVGGFSFGAWVSMQLLMRRPEIDGFISVSPPANMYEFNFLAPCPVSGLITQGDQDDIVDMHQVTDLVERLRNQRGIEIGYNLLKGADHFFTNHMKELCDTVTTYVEERFTPDSQQLAV